MTCPLASLVFASTFISQIIFAIVMSSMNFSIFLIYFVNARFFRHFGEHTISKDLRHLSSNWETGTLCFFLAFFFFNELFWRINCSLGAFFLLLLTETRRECYISSKWKNRWGKECSNESWRETEELWSGTRPQQVMPTHHFFHTDSAWCLVCSKFKFCILEFLEFKRKNFFDP